MIKIIFSYTATTPLLIPLVKKLTSDDEESDGDLTTTGSIGHQRRETSSEEERSRMGRDRSPLHTVASQ